MSTVLVTARLPEGATAALDGHEVLGPLEPPGLGPGGPSPQAQALLARAEALVCLLTDRIDAAVLDLAPRLKVVANVAVGYDNVDVEAASARGIVVCHTPGVLDETTADLAFALVLAASRRLSEAEADLRAGRFAGWGLTDYLGQDVHGATLGIVGFGRIGRAVARRAEGFRMRVLHHQRTPTGLPGYVADLDELLRASDVVSLHVPLTEHTHHLIDRRRLALMKPTAVLVNTARGPVVDEEALAEALETGGIFAAGLDVYEREPTVHPRLLAARRAVLLPHIGSASVATRTAMARMAVADAARVLAGDRPLHPVPEQRPEQR
jgi:glyoxylate reductase